MNKTTTITIIRGAKKKKLSTSPLSIIIQSIFQLGREALKLFTKPVKSVYTTQNEQIVTRRFRRREREREKKTRHNLRML